MHNPRPLEWRVGRNEEINMITIEIDDCEKPYLVNEIDTAFQIFEKNSEAGKNALNAIFKKLIDRSHEKNEDAPNAALRRPPPTNKPERETKP